MDSDDRSPPGLGLRRRYPPGKDGGNDEDGFVSFGVRVGDCLGDQDEDDENAIKEKGMFGNNEGSKVWYPGQTMCSTG